MEIIKYLGTIIDNTGKFEEEINNRISLTVKLYHSMKRCFINKKEISIKIKPYTCLLCCVEVSRGYLPRRKKNVTIDENEISKKCGKCNNNR